MSSAKSFTYVKLSTVLVVYRCNYNYNASMGHSNIYIRKENEAAWDAIQDKSRWLNEQLKACDVILQNPKSSKVVNNVLNKDIIDISKVNGLCEHGCGARLCRVKFCRYYQFKRG